MTTDTQHLVELRYCKPVRKVLIKLSMFLSWSADRINDYLYPSNAEISFEQSAHVK